MKIIQLSRTAFALAGSLLLNSVTVRAGEVVINNFDDPAEILPYAWENWSSPTDVGFDTQNAGGGLPGSGSLRITNNFPNNPGGYSQCVFTGALPGGQVDAVTLYSKISFDLKLDPLSYPRVNGTDYGLFELHLRNGGGWTWIGAGQTRFTNNNWVHYSFDVPTTADQVHRLTFKLGENNLTNTVIYNVDNIRWTESTVAPPPPTMSVEKTEPGLNFVAATAGQYDRQSIATVANTFGWIGSSEPMSYSMTISKFPDATTYPGFSAHFYLVPGVPGTEDAPDWNEPTCALITIHANANGTATMEYHYKTNAPGSNGKPTLDGTSGQYFNQYATNGPVGWIGNVTGAGILGTWTVTINQDTNITMIAPDSTASSFVMPPEDAAQFAGGGTIYYGIVPGQTANVGQKAILSRVQIKSGATTLLEDNFGVAPLDSAVWNIRAVSPAGSVALITTNEPYYVWWTTPATGFTLQTNADLNPLNWGDPGVTDVAVGAKRRALIPSAALPSAGKGFFRLVRQSPVAPPILLESFESGVFSGAANPPYTNVAQSTVAGVTEGTYSMLVNFDASQTWSWIGKNYGASTYTDWRSRSKLVFDLHRAPETFGWNLNFAVAINGEMGWNQNEVVAWVWHNAAETTSQTITWDYSAIKAASPATGTYFQLNFMARGGSGGNVYIDNVRFAD